MKVTHIRLYEKGKVGKNMPGKYVYCTGVVVDV
jgi:hypothetical protein